MQENIEKLRPVLVRFTQEQYNKLNQLKINGNFNSWAEFIMSGSYTKVMSAVERSEE